MEAVVGDDGAVNDDLHDLVALARAHHVAVGAAPVVLLQTVLKVEGLALKPREVNDHVHALGHRDAAAIDLHGPLHQVAVGADLPEGEGGVVGRVGEEELVEARRPGVAPAAAIPPRGAGDHRVDLPVDEELVAEDAVEIEQVEGQQPGILVKDLVVDDHVDVEVGERVLAVAERGQAEARGLVAGVELVEEDVGPGETLVGVFRRVVDAVVVIPQRVHRFFEVARAGVRRVDAGVDVRVVVVVELAALHEEAGEAVTFGRRVPVVQVGRDGGLFSGRLLR